MISSTAIVLTDRETEVLGMAAEGWSNAEIGAQLHLTEDTIKTHVRRMMRKLGARNRAHAVHIAHTAGLPMPGPGQVQRTLTSRRMLENSTPVSGKKATHVLRVVNPADPQPARQIPIAAANGAAAEMMLRQAAGQVAAPALVLLYRVDDLTRPLARLHGFKSPA